MVEPIPELRRRCQDTRKGNVLSLPSRVIMQKVSIYATWALLHTSATANHATLIYMVLSLAASALFLGAEAGWFLAGALLFQVAYVFDFVDGEIARYSGCGTLSGMLFSQFAEFVAFPSFFFCIGLGLFLQGGRPVFLLLGYSAAIFWVVLELTADLRHKVIYLSCRYGTILSQVSYRSERKDGGQGPSYTENEMGSMAGGGHGTRLSKLCLRVRFIFRRSFVSNAVLAAAVADLFLPDNPVLGTVIVFYGIATPITALLTLAFSIRHRETEENWFNWLKHLRRLGVMKGEGPISGP